MANCDVDVFVGNNTLIDPDVYQLWLTGYTGGFAVNTLQGLMMAPLPPLRASSPPDRSSAPHPHLRFASYEETGLDHPPSLHADYSTRTRTRLGPGLSEAL